MSRTVTARCDVCGKPATVVLELRNCAADLCEDCGSCPVMLTLLEMQEKHRSWYSTGGQLTGMANAQAQCK